MLIEIYGLLFEVFLGTIGHFLYDLSNKNSIIGFLFSRNESIWEHMKLGIRNALAVVLHCTDTSKLMVAILMANELKL